MERTTVELTLPESGSIVTFYQYLKNSDYRKIRKVMYAGYRVMVNPEDEKNPVQQQGPTQMDGGFVVEAEDVALRCLIKEIRTKEGTVVANITQYVDDLSIPDGKALYNKSDEITGRSYLNPEVKKNSQ
jgi:hypothetical protein